MMSLSTASPHPSPPMHLAIEDESRFEVMSDPSFDFNMQSKRHQSSTVVNKLKIPLWLGCVLLCACLVAGAGLATFLTGDENRLIVSAGRNSYSGAITLVGEALYWKWINEVISLFTTGASVFVHPVKYLAVNISDPMWDSPWQQHFLGYNVLHAERRFLYVDLVTGYFTGQDIRGPATRRYFGNASDVTFTQYTRQTSPVAPLRYNVTGTTTFKFPPRVLAENFLALQTPFDLISPTLDLTGEMMYGFAVLVPNPLNPLVTQGVLIEMVGLETFIYNDSYQVGTPVLRTARVGHLSGESIVFDARGGLVACTYPGLRDVYVPVGTPNAVCSTIHYNNQTVSKCRHSLSTVGRIWPQVLAATQAFPGNVSNNTLAPYFTSVVFSFDGEEYIGSVTTPTVSGQQWWSAAITPVAPIYGPYLVNRRTIIISLACTCVGAALIVLFLTYALLLPLGSILEEMTAALMLKTQSHRRAVIQSSMESAADVDNDDQGASSTNCGSLVAISELNDIGNAVVSLHALLEDIATMLPPPVILSIRTNITLRQHQYAIGDDMLSNCSVEDDRLTHSDDSNIKTRVEDDHLVQMLSWIEGYYRSRGAAPTTTTSGMSDPLMSSLSTQPIVEIVGDEAFLDEKPKQSILVPPSVSLRPAKRRGYFLAMSVTNVRCAPEELHGLIAPLLSIIWHFGGDVETIERTTLLASFGCYDDKRDAGDRAVLCAIALGEAAASQLQLKRLSISVDCGWFDLVTFSCHVHRRVIRRQLVVSVARQVAQRLLSLADVLHERILITGDVLRQIDPKTLHGTIPRVVDHLKFDTRTWSKMSRRGSIFVFGFPSGNQGMSASKEHGLAAAVVSEYAKEEARIIAEGFRWMMGARYLEAEAHFQRFATWEDTSKYIARMHALCSVFANILRVAPNTSLAAYYRSESLSCFERMEGETVEEKLADVGDGDDPCRAGVVVFE